MNLESQRILVTGASGGIGQVLCRLLAERRARLCLVDRQAESGERLKQTLQGEVIAVAADITHPDDRARAVNAAMQAFGGVDVLINLAGVMDFARFDEQDPGLVERIISVNIEAPMQLARAEMPQMRERGHGRIVNVGSMFGSIGFPCFAAYAASKFALRGFSEALRRELAGSGVGVTYIAPRAVKTPLNPPAVHRMAELGLMHMDPPEWVAERIVRAMEKERSEAYLGFPESLFARLNAVLPGVVGRAIGRQLPTLMAFAQIRAKA